MYYKNTPEGRAVQSKYGKILHASRPEPPHNYPRMLMSNRAKIFSPFAALREWRFLYCGMTELWGHVRKAEAGNGEPGASGVPVTLANPGGNGKP